MFRIASPVCVCMSRSCEISDQSATKSTTELPVSNSQAALRDHSSFSTVRASSFSLQSHASKQDKNDALHEVNQSRADDKVRSHDAVVEVKVSSHLISARGSGSVMRSNEKRASERASESQSSHTLMQSRAANRCRARRERVVRGT